MSIVIRDIWVEVEATVKDYQKEAAQTRSENARLKQQLKDVLSRNKAHLNGKLYILMLLNIVILMFVRI